MKVEVVVLGSPSLTSLMVSVDVKQHKTKNSRGTNHHLRTEHTVVVLFLFFVFSKSGKL